MQGVLLPAMMFSLMLGMGLSLTPRDFLRIAEVPGPILTGTLLQLVGMPVIGLMLVFAYELMPALAIGLVVCAACPGGLGSNIFVHLGRANTALSISLTAAATTFTLFTLPLWIRATQLMLGNEASAVEIPLLATASELGGLTVLPVALGMSLRHGWPFAARLERPLTALAAVGLFFVLVRDSMQRPDPPHELFLLSLPPALWFAAIAVGLGFSISRGLGQSVADAVTISTELCVKNVLLGMVVLSSSFGTLEFNIPLLVYSGVMAPPAILICVAHRIYQARRSR
jgi:BASS family bile acid:Na+ symporter